ncbi:hypothetical protein [Hymenobacter sp. YC55]|uniref:hypothetical protein n=1 Tax=Hymenobacter sp. YC55 TaxID=3034019 RepID=UPI0023F632EF|nr:hypothetical protein [Hymenobacter sp. YC55]MDF7810898.1 hypothetical protein [Hymenobacter sp. YC55]
MNIDWNTKMFIASVLGSLAALFWPVAIHVWRVEIARYQASLSTSGVPGGMIGAGGRRGRSLLIKWIEKLVKLIVLPFLKIGARWIRFGLLALFIASIASAVGFAGFLQNDEVRKKLQELGALGFFAAFNYGFTASSLVEEALKTPAKN